MGEEIDLVEDAEELLEHLVEEDLTRGEYMQHWASLLSRKKWREQLFMLPLTTPELKSNLQ